MKFFQKGELKLLWPFYLDALISPMLFFVPAFFIPYFNSLGFSLFQIGVLLAAVPLFSLLFEIPTGAVADLYGRRFSVLLGTVLEGIGFLALFFFTDFYLILATFALIGFAATFSSGADEAWVTDLIKTKKKDWLHDYFLKTQSIDSFGLIVSGLIGALLVKLFGLSVIWIVAAVSFLVAAVILSFGKENFKKSKVHVRNSFKKVKNQAIKSVNYSMRHRVLFYFLIAGAILVFAGNFGGFLSWIPFLQNLGFPDYAFGYMWSAMAFVGMVTPFVSKQFYKKGEEKGFIVNTLIILILITLLIIFVKELIFASIIFLSLIFFDSLSRPAERVYFHRFIPSKIRASVGSVEAMWLSIIGIIAMPLAGLSVDLIGAQYTIFLSGILMIPAAIVYYRIKEKD